MNPQLKKGVLELCVLSQLTKEDKYGYELTDAISREMSIAAGTLYMISAGIRLRPRPEILPSD